MMTIRKVSRVRVSAMAGTLATGLMVALLVVTSGCSQPAARQPGEAGQVGDAAGNQSGKQAPLVGRTLAHVAQGTPREYPAIDLRGYGPNDAQEMVLLAPGGERITVLAINAEDEAHAALWQAKFDSDYRSLGHVQEATIQVGERQLPVLECAGGVTVMSLREGARVELLSAPSTAALAAYLQAGGVAQRPQLAATSRAKIPMYLNGWDRYAFRLYYRPWALPTPEDTTLTYDPIGEFNWAQRNENLGMVFWANLNQMDGAAGLTDRAWRAWAERAATRRDLPMVINTMLAEPSWLLNRMRDETLRKMPGYVGSYHNIANPGLGGMERMSWASRDAREAELRLLSRIWQRYAAQPNVIDFLEPNGELHHGAYDVFTEYGPLADASYRDYLRGQYGDLRALSQRWHGEPDALQDWDQVRVPEVAAFAGWGPEALDLAGRWSVASLQPPAAPAAVPAPPADWMAADFDASAWPTIQAPGDDTTMLLPKEPAAYRRAFTLPPDWRADDQPTWLYVWDLNGGVHLKDHVDIWVNGEPVGHSPIQHARPHWCAVQVDQALRDGENQLAISLPQGYLAYRVYLSHQPPLQYPYLSLGQNRQWVDFIGWAQAIRLGAVRDSLSHIRAAAPDHPVIFMAPDYYHEGMKILAEDYGGRFHNTGHMGAFWNEYLPMLMRSSRLPFSLEPGGPAKDLPGFRKQMGRYLTEGINAIHYFIHAGNIYWPDDIRAEFEHLRPALMALGRSHVPQNEAAMLLSTRARALTSYPWNDDPNVNLPTGYFRWAMNKPLLDTYRMDAVTESDFRRGNAAPYRLIIDTNTSTMDEQTVSDLAAWVEAGGVFVTYVQTGRHLPDEPNAWPISRLTGYDVTAIGEHDQDGKALAWEPLAFAPGQPVFDPAGWPDGLPKANGLKLSARDAACIPLILWEDGSVAAGLRPLGKGYVLTLGLKYAHDRSWFGNPKAQTELFHEIFRWLDITTIPAFCEGPILQHAVSNSGLFDVWSLWNESEDPLTTSLRFKFPLVDLWDVMTGERVELVDGALPLAMDGLQSRMFISPRPGAVATNLGDWYRLQRDWWRGTATPPAPKVDPTHVAQILAVTDNTLDLSDGWYDDADAGPVAMEPRTREELADPDANWLLHRDFQVPAAWQGGVIRLWARSWFSRTMEGQMRATLNGTALPDPRPREGIEGLDVTALLDPNGPNRLTLEIESIGSVPGPRGGVFLEWLPAPIDRLALDGEWQVSDGPLGAATPATLPGDWTGQIARRQVTPPAEWAGHQTYIHWTGSNGLIAVMVNGRYLRRHHHMLGDTTRLNITHLLKLGEPNEIAIVRWGGSGTNTIQQVELQTHDQ